MKVKGKNLLKWEFENLKRLVDNKEIEKIKIIKFEKFLLVELPKNTDYAVDIIAELDKFAIILMREFKKVSVSKKSVRDDIICLVTLINSILGHNKKVSDLISKIENNSINGINNKFVLDKIYRYHEKGSSLTKRHKLWSKLIRSYKKGEISAIKLKGNAKNSRVKRGLKKTKKKGFAAKLREMLGL